jgi:ATP-dependent DNA ligase
MRRATTRLESLPKRKADFIEPMECALVPKLPEGPDWTFEIKLDGYRAIGVKTSREAILYSRNHKNFNKRERYVKHRGRRGDYVNGTDGRAGRSG